MGLRDLATQREPLKLMTTEYTVEASGHVRDEPIIHLFCRRADGSRRHLEVEGFYPYFYISTDAFVEHYKELLSEGRVRHVEVPASVLEEIGDRDLHFMDSVVEVAEPVNTLHGQTLIKVVVGIPDNVSGGGNRDRKGLRGFFDTTWEADVHFTSRFLISTGIHTGLTAPVGDDRVHVDDLKPLDRESVPDVDPRTIHLDIEVYTDGEFPEPTKAKYPVISIVAYDNYDEEYVGWILESEEWDDHIDADWLEAQYDDRWPGTEISVFEEEALLLDSFHEYVSSRRPDMMTGWNAGKNEKSNGFDFPYLINRSMKVNAWGIKNWTPISGGDLYVNRAGTAYCQGIELFDMMAGYMKTQYHELRSYALGFVADRELGYGKEDMDDISDAWQHDVEPFLRYNIRDVEAVVEIEKQKNILGLFDHLRAVTGAPYTECASGNIGMIDMLFLRDALKKNLALPTSKKPTSGYYHGARVFNPTPGRHENVFYPDLASLYPYLFYATNMSPETIVGDADDLAASKWTKDDCFVVYYDPREEEVKRAADHTDVVENVLYVLKPDRKEGFVRDSIASLIDMKYEYDGTDVYQAVKMVTNSVYGVMGDSDTFGRGFRLFDVRIAEAITLAGRKVLEFTANTMEQQLHDNGYDDARLVGGDTDSAMLAGPSLPCDPQQIQRAYEGKDSHPVFDAADYTNEAYDTFMAETFAIDKDEGFEHMMEVEVESAAEAIFFLQDFKSDASDGDGIKKKYCQTMVWKDKNGGTIIENPTPETKGFQLVRSDTATITAWAQATVLELILKSDTPKDDVYDFLKALLDYLKTGDLDALSESHGTVLTLEDVGIPKGISAELDRYGREKIDDETYGEHVRTPSPHIRGAKWANQHLGEDIGAGSKPLLYYVEKGRIGGDLPAHYDTEESLEDGNPVDAIAVEDHRSFPEEARIDWPLMADKLVKNPIEDITLTMGWQWTDITSTGQQTGLDAWA